MPLSVLSALAFLLAALAIISRYRGPAWLHYLTKPLTIVVIVSIALVSPAPGNEPYKWVIVAGLLASLVGDICLMLPSDRFIPGLLSFLVAHVLYSAAFWQSASDPVATGPLGVYGLYGVFMMRLLWPSLHRLKLPVILYMIALLTMGVLATTRYLATPNDGTTLAALGALLFVASDSVLAIDRFRHAFASAQFFILSTYFLAQWCLAMSV